MAAFLWRVVFGVAVVRGVRGLLRLLWRWTPVLAVSAAAFVAWPSTAIAFALRRHGLPRLEQRWPKGARAYGPALAILGAGVGLAFVLLQPEQRRLLVTLHAAGWVAPLTVPLGGISAILALQAVALGAPLWLAGGVVLGGLWPAYGSLVRWALDPSIRSPVGGGGRGVGPGNRRSDIGAPVAVTLKPTPTQRIATATFGDDAWTVKPLYGPGLLAMIVAPPGVGKTELCYGSLAAAVDGLDFCGLATARPKRVLLLSEMEPKTLQPALLRWGFYAEAAGPLDRLRLRWLRPDGSPGHLIDVVHASDAYAYDADGRRPEWADVIKAALPIIAKGKYDLLLVDSLARWMGNDSSNAAMLDALGALRQVTRMGVGVLAPHHCAKDAPAPYAPRGGSAILGELDLCWSLAHPPDCTDKLHDPRRVLECVKSRFAELTPPPIRLERVDEDPAARRSRYGYRLLDTAAAHRPSGSPAPAATGDGLSEQQRRVLTALRAADGHTATTPELTAATGLEANRIKEAMLALIRARYARLAGEGPAPARGGRPPVRYAATRLALAQLPETADPDAEPAPLPTTPERPRLRLVAPARDDAVS